MTGAVVEVVDDKVEAVVEAAAFMGSRVIPRPEAKAGTLYADACGSGLAEVLRPPRPLPIPPS